MSLNRYHIGQKVYLKNYNPPDTKFTIGSLRFDGVAIKFYYYLEELSRWMNEEFIYDEIPLIKIPPSPSITKDSFKQIKTILKVPPRILKEMTEAMHTVPICNESLVHPEAYYETDTHIYWCLLTDYIDETRKNTLTKTFQAVKEIISGTHHATSALPPPKPEPEVLTINLKTKETRKQKVQP